MAVRENGTIMIYGDENEWRANKKLIALEPPHYLRPDRGHSAAVTYTMIP